MPLTILLVDDNPIQVETRRAILTHSGNKILVAEDAQKALALLDNPEFAKNVGLVITDHLMPRMNGLQFVIRLRRLLPEISVLVLSGLPGAEAEYSDLNVLYRLKPLDPEELIRLVQALSEKVLGRTA